MNFYTVYINYSEVFDKFYIGQTQNYESRLLLHNSGKVASTRPYIPWMNVLRIEKETRSEAIILERKLENLNRVRLLEIGPV